MEDFESQLESLAALEEPVRRKLYLFVVGRDGVLVGIASIDDVLELLGDELHTIGRVVGRQQPVREWP